MIKDGMLNRRAALSVAGMGLAVGAAPIIAAPASDSKSSEEELVTRYVAAWSSKNLDQLRAVVSADVGFVSPTATTTGRDAYLAAAQRFFGLYTRLNLRAQLVGGGKAMIAYDLDCIPPVGRCPTAELLSIRDHAIVSSEIFFDARPFEALMRNAQHRPGK